MAAARPNADERWMRRALALAWRGAGATRPNPPVGAVVVRGGRRVGEGYHRRAGGPHAEIYALRAAGRAARGATLYVTLEPCSTQGRTPPCTAAILRSGIARVVAAVRDPNPRHRGRGLRRLRAAGVEVVEGVGAPEAAELIRPFRTWILSGRPFVTLKLAVTLDGRIADARGRSRWISGPAARRYVRRLRGRVDAIMVGGRTARLDDPALLPGRAARRPWRVILMGREGLPPRLRALRDERAAQTLLVTTAAGARAARRLCGPRGARVLPVAATGKGRVSLADALRQLGRLGVLHALCEGGGEVAASLLRAGLVDELLLFVAPRVLGGRQAAPAVGGAGWTLRSGPRFRIRDCRRLGADLLIRAEPAPARAPRRGGRTCSRD